MTDLTRLQKALGYQFVDVTLLQLALTHRSAASGNNERLEFLGDSVVNHVVAEALYRKFPAATEGEMSRMRAALVRGETLAQVARELGVGEYLRLGQGERKSGGHRRASILADALEAVAGGILLDSDVDTCRAVLLSWFDSRLQDTDRLSTAKDPKTRLQEYLQGRGKPLPEYRLLDVSGEDHQQQFQVLCSLRKPPLEFAGAGSSRRKAEQAAARSALTRLTEHE